MFRGVFNRFLSSKNLNLIQLNRNYYSLVVFVFNRTVSKCKNNGLVTILKMRNSITSNDEAGLIIINNDLKHSFTTLTFIRINY